MSPPTLDHLLSLSAFRGEPLISRDGNWTKLARLGYGVLDTGKSSLLDWYGQVAKIGTQVWLMGLAKPKQYRTSSPKVNKHEIENLKLKNFLTKNVKVRNLGKIIASC